MVGAAVVSTGVVVALAALRGSAVVFMLDTSPVVSGTAGVVSDAVVDAAIVDAGALGTGQEEVLLYGPPKSPATHAPAEDIFCVGQRTERNGRRHPTVEAHGKRTKSEKGAGEQTSKR
jgi:hypothetical protein